MYKSINSICLSVSIWTTLVIGFLLLFCGVYAFITDLHQSYRVEQKQLNIVGPLLSNILTGELILEDEVAINAIKEEFKKKYNLESIAIDKQKIQCPKNSFFKSVCWEKKIDTIKPAMYLLLSSSIKISFDSIKKLVDWTLLPLVMLSFFISFLIRKRLFNSIVEPIVSLSNSPLTWRPKNKNVAKEVVEVHERFMSFIDERDLQIKNNEKLEKEAAIGKLVAQVVHDIRSPLAALDIMIDHLKNIPENERLVVKNATNRIHDIANNLLNQNKKTENGTSSEPIVCLILNIVSEKRIQYKNINLDLNIEFKNDVCSEFVYLPTVEFGRVISNLINNAVEALDKSKQEITVYINNLVKDIEIKIRDNGRGMTKQMIQQIVSGDIRSNKEKGHGLGLSHAIKLLDELWNVKLNIYSVLGEGTTIGFKIPKSPTPKWFADKIYIPQNFSVVVVDDDPSIHDVWKNKLTEQSQKIPIINFYNLHDFEGYVKNEKLSQSVFLVDYEFANEKQNGLDILEKLMLVRNVYLVTSRFEDKKLRVKVEELGIKILPKNLSPFVSICSK